MNNDGSKKEKTSVCLVLKGYLRRKAVRVYIGGPDTPLPESSLDNLIKNEKFPLPIFISTRTPVWSISEIDEWLQNRRNPTMLGLGRD